MILDNTLTITQNTWIISDTHFFHENIGRYCNRPENWQELIINNWNNLISQKDTVLHLGDFALGKKVNFELVTGILNGRLFLIQGNHDRLSQSFCEAHGLILIKNSLLVELENQMKLIFSLRPIVPLEDGWVNLHGHIHNVPPPPEGSNLGPDHINMSVEVREYRPWRLGELLKTSRDHPTENDVSLR
ncbi:MAG: metallophosphoesterase [Anaerolineaceae bacterium]